MNIRIALNALSAVSGGGVSVARGLCTALARIRPNWRFLLFASREEAVSDQLPGNVETLLFPGLQSATKRWRFEQLRLPRILSRAHVDAMILFGGFKVFSSRVPQIAIWQNAHIWTPTTEAQPIGLRAYIKLQKLAMLSTTSRVALNVFLSQDSADRAREARSIREHRIAVLPIGLDDDFSNQEVPPSRFERDPILLAVGDVYAHKRFEIAIDALADLRSTNSELELWIAGRILDHRCHKHLVDQIERRSVANRVRFLGHVPRGDLIRLYRRAMVLIATSRLETFGLTPIEAMACGLPVVACPESAIPEVCADGALYADPIGNSVADAIGRLFSDPGQWSEQQQRGHRRAVQFTWPIVAAQYAALIESVMSDWNAKPR